MGRERKLPLKRFILAFIALVVGQITNLSQAAPSLNLTLTATATSPNVTLHAGSGDEAEGGVAALGTSTALTPVLADWNSKFITGNFDGAAPANQTFQTSFTNWNVAQGANYGGMWTIINGGNLDLEFYVVDSATANNTFGGTSFSVGFIKNAGYAGPNSNQLVWTQALYNSYSTQPPFSTDLNPPLNTLDTYSTSKGNPGSGGAFTIASVPIPGQMPGPDNTTPAVIGATPADSAYSDPIYPFQDGNQMLSDSPSAYWPDESFRAIALLSTVTFKTDAAGDITERDLTVYNGISWGFDLSVPEPASTMVLIVLGSAILLRRPLGRAA